MTAVAHLLPENVAEAGLDPDQTRRCTAQAASMMRQADSLLRTLMRLQADRQKAEDACRPAAMQRAGYCFRSASPEPDPAEPPGPPLPSREGDGGRGPASPPKLEYGAMTPAERYVTLYPTAPPRSSPPAACPRARPSRRPMPT